MGKSSPEKEEKQNCRKQERKRLKAELPIGPRLRQIRDSRQMTQEQVASLLALNRTAYTHYENGVNMPDILTLVRLAEIYALPPGELVQYLTGRAAGENPSGPLSACVKKQHTT